MRSSSSAGDRQRHQPADSFFGLVSEKQGMNKATLSHARANKILSAAKRRRILVVGDVMLDQFIWGKVARISPEAPVPVVDFERESFMPGGAANVARNLTALKTPTELLGIVGRDHSA